MEGTAKSINKGRDKNYFIIHLIVSLSSSNRIRYLGASISSNCPFFMDTKKITNPVNANMNAIAIVKNRASTLNLPCI